MAPPIKKNIIGDKSRQTEKLQTCSTKNYFESEDEISKLLSLDKVETDFRSYIKQLRSILLTNTTNIRRQEFRDLLLIAAVKLRNLNRHSNFYNKVHSSRLSGARSNIEAHYLSLQNVTNEITHLRKNIETCLEFQSSDADIELTDSIELNSNKNGEMNDHDHPSANPHQVHLARLNYELNERKSMLANLQELEGRKSALLSDIRGKEQRLLQIRPKIGSIKRSVGPFLELLGVNIRSNCTSPKFNHQMLHLRPIFMNDDVCCEIFGSTFVELGVNSEVILDEPKMEVEQLSVSDVANNANNVPLSTANVGKFIAAEETLASLQQINVKGCELTTLIKSMIMGNDLFSDSIIQEFFQRAILLRRLYRQVNIQNRMSYKKLSELRSKLEQHSAELYTQTAQIVYLKKSIEILTDQKSSQDLDIELIPVKEFYSELPISVSRPDITKNDAHKLHLLRLKHELATRKNLLENVQKLENDKKALLTSISAIERTFTKIDPRVENLKKISKPLFDIVGLKSIALSVHNKEVPFRPVKIDNETIKEIFGGNLQEDGVDNRGMIEEDEQLEDLEQEIAMQIDDV